MRTRTIIATTAILAGGLAACLSSSSDDTSSTDSKPKATTTSAATASPSSAFLRPTAAQEKVLIRGLTAIDPGLTVKESRAISRSVGVCDDIRTGKDHATVVDNAAFRYDGGNASVDDVKAEKIVQVIKDSYCAPR